MSKSFLLCRLSGTGKSTLAKKLSTDFEANITTESDTIHTWLCTQMSFLRNGAEDINSLSYKITQVITKVYQSVEILIISRQSSIIIDACHLTESTRSKISKLLPEPPILIHIICDENTLLNRLSQRNNPDVWQELHKNQKEMFQSPIHPDVVYDTSQDNYEDIKRKIQQKSQ